MYLDHFTFLQTVSPFFLLQGYSIKLLTNVLKSIGNHRKRNNSHNTFGRR